METPDHFLIDPLLFLSRSKYKVSSGSYFRMDPKKSIFGLLDYYSFPEFSCAMKLGVVQNYLAIFEKKIKFQSLLAYMKKYRRCTFKEHGSVHVFDTHTKPTAPSHSVIWRNITKHILISQAHGYAVFASIHVICTCEVAFYLASYFVMFIVVICSPT